LNPGAPLNKFGGKLVVSVVAAHLYRNGKNVKAVSLDEPIDCKGKSEFVWIGIHCTLELADCETAEMKSPLPHQLQGFLPPHSGWRMSDIEALAFIVIVALGDGGALKAAERAPEGRPVKNYYGP
jgi:hypothetical protein